MQRTTGQKGEDDKGDRANETPADCAQRTCGQQEGIATHDEVPHKEGEFIYADGDGVYYLQHHKYNEYRRLTDQQEKKDFILSHS